MQSTGHSSIHALSLMSTQGSAIVYVTEVSSISCQWAAGLLVGPAENSLQVSVTDTWTPVSVCPNFRIARLGFRVVTDTRRCTYSPPRDTPPFPVASASDEAVPL